MNANCQHDMFILENCSPLCGVYRRGSRFQSWRMPVGNLCVAVVAAMSLLLAPLALSAQEQTLSANVRSSAVAQNDAVVDDVTKHTLVVVVGAGGTDEYEREFQSWAEHWREVARQTQADITVIGGNETGIVRAEGTDDRQRLQQTLNDVVHTEGTLWLIMIGHGTFDGHVAKFNLRGPDVSSAELAEWLQARTATSVVINCASSSAPFINHLSAPNRIVVSATSSGYEQNYARFGQYLSEALNSDEADLDHDQQVSLLEAFLLASNQTARFYEQESRLATEHSLLDDNGDKLGTAATFFRGTRVVERPQTGEPDGRAAHRLILVPGRTGLRLSAPQQRRRDQLEDAMEALRQQKKMLDEDRYYQHLEVIAVQLANLYREVAAASVEEPPATAETTAVPVVGE